MPFGEIPKAPTYCLLIDGKNGQFLKTLNQVPHSDLCLKSMTHFMPPPQSWGVIARTCMYMVDLYPPLESIIFKSIIDRSTLISWNDLYPVEEWEKDRAERIISFGYPRNRFVI